MFAHLRNSVTCGRKRNRSEGGRRRGKGRGGGHVAHAQQSHGVAGPPSGHRGPRSPLSPNPVPKQRSRHSSRASFGSGGGSRPSSRGSRPGSRERGRPGSRESRRGGERARGGRPLSGAFSALSLEEQAEELEKCAHFKKNLGRLLKAHDHNWRKVPFFFFVDEWISDEGTTITKNRLKQATAARKRFGIAN